MAFDLRVNGTLRTVDADPQTPLLWVIRDHVGLTGTAAQITGIPEQNVHLHMCHLGGGFGRNGTDPRRSRRS